MKFTSDMDIVAKLKAAGTMHEAFEALVGHELDVGQNLIVCCIPVPGNAVRCSM